MKRLMRIITLLLLTITILAAQTGAGISLEDLIELGLANNPNMSMAERNLLSAKAEKRSSISGLIPSVSTSLGRDLNPQDTNRGGNFFEATPVSSSWRISQTIFDGGASLYRNQSGSNAVRKAQLDLENTRRKIILAVKQNYFGYLKARAINQVDQEALDLAKRDLNLVEERYKLQAVKQTDYLAARVRYGSAEITVFNSEKSLTSARINLNLVLGQSPITQFEINEADLEPIPLMSSAEAHAQLMANNTEIASQRVSTDDAWLTAKSSRGRMLPSISLSHSQYTTAADVGSIYKDITRSTSLNFSIPIFTGFNNSSNYARAKYNALISEDRQTDLELRLAAVLENTLATLENLHRIVPVNEEVLAAAEAEVELANEQYRLGAVSILDLLTAQVNFNRAKSTLVRWTYDIKSSEAELEELMGTIK